MCWLQAFERYVGLYLYVCVSVCEFMCGSVAGPDQNYFWLQGVPDSWIRSTQYPSPDSSGVPSYFSINGTSSGLLTAQVYPKPDGVYNIDFYLLDPQDDLTNATDTLTCPEFPVIMGVWARAIAERGEDGIRFKIKSLYIRHHK